jgi:hypothetical protein
MKPTPRRIEGRGVLRGEARNDTRFGLTDLETGHAAPLVELAVLTAWKSDDIGKVEVRRLRSLPM